jgi:negative regulator of flagellin synthesis FlgM
MGGGPAQQGSPATDEVVVHPHAPSHGKDFKAGSVKKLKPARNETMKIQTSSGADTSRQIDIRRATNTNTDYASVTAQQSNAVTAGSSAVKLSSSSTLHGSSATDIDTDKVAAIKAALRDGTYSTDSASIADGMLGLARDLLQTTLH